MPAVTVQIAILGILGMLGKLVSGFWGTQASLSDLSALSDNVTSLQFPSFLLQIVNEPFKLGQATKTDTSEYFAK